MDRGYDVVICDIKDPSRAVKVLQKNHCGAGANAYGIKCDVGVAKSVQELAKFSKSKLKTINYWINNAGVNGGRRALRDVPVEQVELVVKVNLLGTLICTKVAMDIMAEQQGVTGHIFNTVGSGVKGGGRIFMLPLWLSSMQPQLEKCRLTL